MNPGTIWSQDGAELRFRYSVRNLNDEYLYVFDFGVDDEWEAKIAVYAKDDEKAKCYAIEACKAKLRKYRLIQRRADCWMALCERLHGGDLSCADGADEMRRFVWETEKEIKDDER